MQVLSETLVQVVAPLTPLVACLPEHTQHVC